MPTPDKLYYPVNRSDKLNIPNFRRKDYFLTQTSPKKEISQLVVDDNGPGIPSEQLPFIFERFSRGSNMGSNVKGFGLGLAIAQKIANLHEAKLSAGNHEGTGARFSFEIKNI
jgi:signal transduction histidine kinase